MKYQCIVILTSLLAISCSRQTGPVRVTPDSPDILYTGRFDDSDSLKRVFMYSGSAIGLDFTGTSVDLIMKDDSLRNLYTVILDDSLFIFTANHNDNVYRLAENMEDKKHHVEIIRRTEWHGGNTTFLGFRLAQSAKTYKPEERERKIEFIGDSYTCGYGNEGQSPSEHFNYTTENSYLSFSSVAARELNARYVAVCRSGIGITQGYGGYKGFTMPRYYDEVTGDSTVRWNFSRYQPQLVVIDLGGNDLSAPLDSAVFVNAYTLFLKRIRVNYPDAVIVCVAGPSGADKRWITWRNLIHTVVNEASADDSRIRYFEFSPITLHGSDYHPNVAEHKQMAAELVPFVKQLMNW